MIDIITIAIAAMALFATVWNVITTQKHNRLQVKPHLNIYEHFFSDWSGIYTSNIGLGPAIIKSFRVLIDGKDVSGTSLEIWSKAFTDLGFTNDYKELKFTAFKTGHAISTNDPIRLVQLNSEDEPNEDNYRKKKENLQKALKEKIVIEIEYTSMYENKTWKCSWPT